MEALRFASTKIQPPRQRVARVERPQLDGAVARALQAHRVVLLQAPAGFGKTSALAAQLALAQQQGPGLATAWVSLDSDDDAERLFACLVAALEPHDLPWRTAPEALVSLAGSGDASGLQRAAAELLNALADCEAARGVIVLDDLHRVEQPAVFTLLDLLIERLPARWTLVLASRTAPPLALARLRAGRRAGRVQPGRPALQPRRGRGAARRRGAAAGGRARGRAVRAHRRLARRAAAGAGGAAHARRQAAAGHALIDRHLFDYLATEVLDEMPAPLHDFLLRTAVLPELTAPRAAAVSGDARAAEWLDEIERRGLFVTALDAEERTLVLHDLFRDALLQRLQQRLPGELPALLRRAAAGETDALRRVGYLLRGAATGPAAEAALAEAADALFLRRRCRRGAAPGGAGAAGAAQRALAAAGRRRGVPALAVGGHGALVRAGRRQRRAQRRHAPSCTWRRPTLASALYPLDRNAEAEALIAALHAQGTALAPTARALTLLADCSQHFRRGEHLQLPALYGELLDILERGESLVRWWECAPPVNWSTIAGMQPLMARYVAGVLPRLGDRPLPMRGELRLVHAFGHLWAGRMPEALAEIEATEADMQWLAVSGELQVNVELFRMIVDGMLGRGPALQARLQARLARQAQAAASTPASLVLWRHHMAVYGIRLTDSVGADPAGLQAWAMLLKEDPLRNPAANNPRATAVRARYRRRRSSAGPMLRRCSSSCCPSCPRWT